MIIKEKGNDEDLKVTEYIEGKCTYSVSICYGMRVLGIEHYDEKVGDAPRVSIIPISANSNKVNIFFSYANVMTPPQKINDLINNIQEIMRFIKECEEEGLFEIDRYWEKPSDENFEESKENIK